MGGAARLVLKISICAPFYLQLIGIFLLVTLKKPYIFHLPPYLCFLAEKCMTLHRSFWNSQYSYYVKMSDITFRQIYSFQNPMILNIFKRATPQRIQIGHSTQIGVLKLSRVHQHPIYAVLAKQLLSSFTFLLDIKRDITLGCFH